jgi:hypothetical protein
VVGGGSWRGARRKRKKSIEKGMTCATQSTVFNLMSYNVRVQNGGKLTVCLVGDWPEWNRPLFWG